MKLAVAMSGGVDSSVVAKMLVDEGHQVVGLFLKLWQDPKSVAGSGCHKENRCCNYEALEDARKVANQLKIPFYVINAEKAFKETVVDDFLDEYKSLRTPNPCIVCNDKIKFDLLLKKTLDIGCDRLATGHYARINEKEGMYQLFTGVDETKDQSYMLYRLGQDQLSKILFPLGEMTKKEVRKLASDWDLPVKEKEESQEICFVNDDYRSFLRRYLPNAFIPGEIVDIKGKIVGRHQGLINYTVGQRKGISQVESQKSKVHKVNNQDSTPLYVIGFNKDKNQLLVGEDQATYKNEMLVSDLHWILPNTLNLLPATKLSVKIRYRHPAVAILRISNLKSGEFKVLFQAPQRAITPGQSAVFYLNDQVVGGGIIQ